MLETLPDKLREYKLHADVRTLLLLRKSMTKGLVKTLGDMYNVLKGIVVKEPDMMGPFTRAFYDYFLNIDIQNGETLNDAILRSGTFRKWRDDEIEIIKDETKTVKELESMLSGRSRFAIFGKLRGIGIPRGKTRKRLQKED